MSDAMHALLTATPLLDVHHPDIETMVARRRWRTLSDASWDDQTEHPSAHIASRSSTASAIAVSSGVCDTKNSRA